MLTITEVFVAFLYSLSILYLTRKYLSSSFHVCCIYSSAFQTGFYKNMNPVQTAPREQSDLGPYCLQYRLPSRWIKRLTGGKTVNSFPTG